MERLLRRLERWQEGPDPVLADLIDVTPVEEPVWQGSGTARRASAIASIEAVELHALPAVFSVLRETRSVKQANLIAQALVDHWPADPRLTTQVWALLQQAPWVGATSMKVWRRLFEVMVRTPDVRQRRFSELQVSQVFPGRSQSIIERRVQTLTQRHVPRSEATEEELASWSQQLAAHHEREERRARRRAEVHELLAQYRDTGERELLFVLADAWQELGEPRGAYLALCLRDELDKAGRAACKRLLKAHQDAWLGPLAAIVTKKDRVWRDGFLRQGKLYVRNRASLEAAVGHPAWWQIEHLDFGGFTGMAERPLDVVHADWLPNLRSVGGMMDVRELWSVLQRDTIREVHLARPPWDEPVGRAGWGGGAYALERVVMHASWAEVASVLVANLQVAQVVVELEGANTRDRRSLEQALPQLRTWAPLSFVGPGSERLQI